MIRRTRGIAAFLAAACLAVAANAVPYLRTQRAYAHDAQEFAGFPFAFRKVGGDCWPAACETYTFHAGYFMADLAIALAFALGVGLIAARTGQASSRKS